MATLHVVNRESALAACLHAAAERDEILLIEDGIYAAVKPQPRPMLAIDTDVQTRGVRQRLAGGISIVSYAEFVELAVKHNPIVTWC